MKKIALALCFSGALLTASAQDGNNICVWNSLNTYNTGGGPSDLERGIKCADEAAVHEVTSTKSKTWYYRGQLYTLVFLDTVLNKTYGTAAFEAIKAFAKLNEINDTKFKEWDDVTKYAYPLATNTFNAGVDYFQDKNYAQAYEYFYAIKDINKVLEARGKTPNIDLATALKNAAIAAENSGNNEAAIKVYNDWIAIAPSAIGYRSLGLAYKRKGDVELSKKTIDEGLTKFPKDANLLVEKINFFLENSQYPEALGYVNNLLDVEPNNDGALFIKGLAYEKIGNEDSVVHYYLRAAEVNPKNVKVWNNLGAIYVMKANDLVEPMNKLGNSAEDIKKYEEMKKQRKAYYLQAKPYLDKAHELEPDDVQINKVLKTIEIYTSE